MEPEFRIESAISGIHSILPAVIHYQIFIYADIPLEVVLNARELLAMKLTLKYLLMKQVRSVPV